MPFIRSMMANDRARRTPERIRKVAVRLGVSFEAGVKTKQTSVTVPPRTRPSGRGNIHLHVELFRESLASTSRSTNGVHLPRTPPSSRALLYRCAAGWYVKSRRPFQKLALPLPRQQIHQAVASRNRPSSSTRIQSCHEEKCGSANKGRALEGRYGSNGDIVRFYRHFCFAPEGGHRPVRSA
jgi:hypothetical protein